MGHTNQTSHLFLKPELRYRNAILFIHGQLEEKPTEGQGLRIAICHNMQENIQRQLRHITNKLPYCFDSLAQRATVLGSNDEKNITKEKRRPPIPPGFSVYRRNSGPQRVRRHMSQLLRAPSKSVAFFAPAVCFSSCKKGGIWKVELISQCYLWHCSILPP